jgi:hypothetical protein
MNLLFWTAMVGELGEYLRLRREGKLRAFSQAQQIRIAGRRGQEVTERLTIASLLRNAWARLRR